MTKTNYQKIREFHDALGETPANPVVPGADILQLRQTLIREEYEEVMAAFGEVTAVLQQGGESDMANLAHELADLLYVVYGTFADCGIDADAVYAAVHRANMAKLAGPRRADGKLLKPPGWQPADVRGVIKGMGE